MKNRLLTRIERHRRIDRRKRVGAGRRQERDQCRHLFLPVGKRKLVFRRLGLSGRGFELRVLSGIGDIFSLHGIEKLSVLGLVQLVGREVEIGVSCDLRFGQADRVPNSQLCASLANR